MINNIIYLDKIDSTNNYAFKHLDEFEDKQVIIAELQTQGKGRFNRKWFSEIKNNIYMSIVLKPEIDINKNIHLHNITQYMAVVICQVIEEYGVRPEIKWPNDVLVNGKKIAGILSESAIQGQQINGFVLGCGINLNMSKENIKAIDKPADALNLLVNKDIDKSEFINRLLIKFFDRYNELLEKGFILIKKEYLNRSSFLNKKIAVSKPDGSEYFAVAKYVDDNGFLCIINENGEEQILTQ